MDSEDFGSLPDGVKDFEDFKELLSHVKLVPSLEKVAGC
jgi:hypothetical protein